MPILKILLNLASFGNVVPHLHWHLIPRYLDDRHFPQPVWGPRQREVDGGAAERLGMSLEALDACVVEALSARD